MMTIKHEILTYKPYRIVCDHCVWESESYELLSEVSRAMTAHLRSVHVKAKPNRPAPIKPSQVTARHAE